MLHTTAPGFSGKRTALLTAIVLCAAAVMPPCNLRMLIFTALTGILPLLMFRARWGAVSLLLLSLPVGQILWSGLILVLGTLGGPRAYDYSSWAMLVLLGAMTVYAQHKAGSTGRPVFAAIRFRPVPAEWCALAFAVLAAFPLTWCLMHNGATTLSDGAPGLLIQVWVSNDTLYQCALAEQILARGGLPAENPFMAGVSNYYPAFFHCGLAGLTHLTGNGVFTALWPWMLLHGMFSMGLMGLVISRLCGSMLRWRGVLFGSLSVALFLAQRYDLVLFPQTNFTVMPVLMLATWLLFDLNGRVKSMRALSIAVVVAVTIIIGHTVSSVAMLALLSTVSAVMLLRPDTRRAALFLGVILVGMSALLLIVNYFPHAGKAGYFQREQFSAWLCFRILQGPLFLPLVFCGAAIAMARSRARLRFGILAFLMFTIGTFYTAGGFLAPDGFSRWFRLFNAPRFWQTGLLLALPAAAFITGTRLRKTAIFLPIAALTGVFVFPFPTATIASSYFGQKPIAIENPIRAQDGMLHFLRTQSSPTDTVSSNLSHIVGGLIGRCELMPDEENLWGMDTLPPGSFLYMAEEYRRIWNSDDDPQITQQDRLKVLQDANIRWLLGACNQTENSDDMTTQIQARFPAGTLTHVGTKRNLVLFRVN